MLDKKTNKILEDWDKATDKLAKYFVKKYFGNPKDCDFFWIGSKDKDRDVLNVGDYVFDLDRMVDAIRYQATEKDLFNYYDMEIELSFKNKKLKHSFRDYIKRCNDKPQNFLPKKQNK